MYQGKKSPQWIPRTDNVKADLFSKTSDCDDWEIKEYIFNHFDKKWGRYSIDRFASDYNKKCIRFNSKHWCTGTEGIDAFNYTWAGENNWIVPPPSLIAKCILKILQEHVTCTLVIPKWTSVAFWPMLVTEGGN